MKILARRFRFPKVPSKFRFTLFCTKQAHARTLFVLHAVVVELTIPLGFCEIGSFNFRREFCMNFVTVTDHTSVSIS